MQFACALAEQLCFLGINAAEQFLQNRGGRRCFILQIGFAFQYALIVAADRVYAESPNIALVRDRALQKANNSRFRFRTAILQCSYKSRHVWKSGLLGKKPREFNVRIHSVLKLTIEFQEEFVVEEH